MISSISTFGHKIPKCRLIRSDLWFHLTCVSCLLVVTGLAGRGGVFPSGLAAQAHRMHMIQSGIGFCDICATVLAGVGITQKYVAFAQPHSVLGFLICVQHDHSWHTSLPSGTVDNPIVMPFQDLDLVQNHVSYGFLPIYNR